MRVASPGSMRQTAEVTPAMPPQVAVSTPTQSSESATTRRVPSGAANINVTTWSPAAGKKPVEPVSQPRRRISTRSPGPA